MALTKYASFEVSDVLEIKGSEVRRRTASLDKLSDFHDYRTSDGYMYVRIRAISSRVNKNHDGWPSVELAGSPEIFERHSKQSAQGFTVEAADGDKQFGFATFVGKPIFVDHNNSDPERARGVIVDAKLNVLPRESSTDSYYSSEQLDKEHMPPTEVELLLEVDAKSFPKFAKAIRSGDLDGFSMGCDVERSKCSHCGHVATNPDEYCSHIVMKGAQHDYKTADGSRISRKSYENCYGIKFFEISGVFDPADETALTKEIRAGLMHEAKTAENELPQSFHTTAPEEIDTLRQEQICPICGESMEGETCDVCGYVEPPKGLDNPDLNKAQELNQDFEQGDDQTIQNDNAAAAGAPPQPQAQQQGSYLQQARKQPATARVISDMRWSPKINPKVAGRINQSERPIKTTPQPATNEPTTETVTSNPTKPVTSAMQTAQGLIEAAKQNHTGDTMSTKTADGTTAPEAAPAARVDVEGVGGVIDATNEQASKSHEDKNGKPDPSGYAQVDVMGTGGVGVTGDIEADQKDSLDTAAEGSDDSGFNKDKTTDDSGPTKTWGDNGTSPVTPETPYWVDESTWSSVHEAYDSKPFYDQEGLSGGSANKGTQPVDAVGKADDRVDVLKSVTTPDNNSGPTSQWTGTDGNGVTKQVDPVTKEVVENNTDKWTSHIVSAMKLADQEVDLGLITKDEKYDRIAELEAQSGAEITAQLNTLARVKVAGTAKLAQQRTAGVTRLPGAFGRRTAAPNPDWRPDGRSFERVTAGEQTVDPQEISEETFDSALFS